MVAFLNLCNSIITSNNRLQVARESSASPEFVRRAAARIAITLSTKSTKNLCASLTSSSSSSSRSRNLNTPRSLRIQTTTMLSSSNCRQIKAVKAALQQAVQWEEAPPPTIIKWAGAAAGPPQQQQYSSINSRNNKRTARL